MLKQFKITTHAPTCFGSRRNHHQGTVLCLAKTTDMVFLCTSVLTTHFLGGQKRPENVAQLRAHIVKLCRVLSEDLCRKVVTNARVRLREVVRQNGGHIEHVLH